jgi:pSer/pThr/pTyr-binding forkhead associated (FHA) protein
MAKIIVSLDGSEISEYELNSEREFVLGRGTMCDIVLAHPKVSRQHAKLFFDGKTWTCKVVSKFGHMAINSHVISEISLTEGTTFSIPPFDIKYVESTLNASPAEDESEGVGKTADLSDRTSVVSIQMKATLRKLTPDGSAASEITLREEPLVAGRSSSCQLVIEDTHASRKHFSIHYDGQHYVLKDLKSANKTYVNGQIITEHILQNGDEISVGQERHQFELIHPEFANLPSVIYDNPQEPSPAVIKYVPYGKWNIQGLILKINSSRHAKFKVGAIFLLLVFVIYSAFSGSKNIDTPRGLAGDSIGKAGLAFTQLPLDQQKFVDETYNLALNLYAAGKYDLASIEIAKVIHLAGDYKEAKNIQALCQQAMDIKKQQDEAEQRTRELEALKQKVSDILDGCEGLIKTKQYSKMAECVEPAKELDPENERAMNLEISARQAQEQLETSKEYKADLARRKAQAAKIYKSAKQALAEKRLPAALNELNKIEKYNFPDQEGLKEKAKQDIAVVKARMLKESQSLVAEGKTSLDSKEYSEAIKKFNQALIMAPFNADAKALRESASRDLHLEMKNMYSESVIEENLGNVESAKKKWATIIKEDEKSDPYYDKAQMKLRKYEN